MGYLAMMIYLDVFVPIWEGMHEVSDGYVHPCRL